MPEYRYCGLGVRSDIAHAELPSLPRGEPIALKILAGEVPRTVAEVTSAQRGLWARNPQEALWELPRVGRFHLREGGRVIVYQRAATVDDDTLMLFLLEVLFPLAAVLRSDFLLHAAAVRLPSGDVVAYTGPSAVGKSSEAALRIREGASLIADSLLRLTVEEDGAVLAYPQAPWLTLWPDMVRRFGWQDRPQRRRRQELTMRRVSTEVLAEPVPLSRLCRLRSREEDAVSALGEVALNRLQWLRQLTAGNAWIDQPAMRQQHFLWSAAILNRSQWETRMRSEVGVVHQAAEVI